MSNVGIRTNISLKPMEPPTAAILFHQHIAAVHQMLTEWKCAHTHTTALSGVTTDRNLEERHVKQTSTV
jgi:hypothetical protein